MEYLALRTCLLVSMTIATGCMGGYLAEYHFRTQVTGLDEAASGSLSVEGLTFATDGLKFDWTINDYYIGVQLANTGSKTIGLRWDQATYVDERGQVQPLTLLEHGKDPTAWAVELAPGRTKKFSVFPSEYVRWSEPTKSWLHDRQLFDPPGARVGRSSEEIIRLAGTNQGETIRVRLPLDLNAKELHVDFAFTITAVRSRKYRDYF